MTEPPQSWGQSEELGKSRQRLDSGGILLKDANTMTHKSWSVSCVERPKLWNSSQSSSRMHTLIIRVERSSSFSRMKQSAERLAMSCATNHILTTIIYDHYLRALHWSTRVQHPQMMSSPFNSDFSAARSGSAFPPTKT